MKRLIISLGLLSVVFALTGTALLLLHHVDKSASTVSIPSESPLKPPTVVILEQNDLVLVTEVPSRLERQIESPPNETHTIPRIVPTAEADPLLDRIAYKSQTSHIKLFEGQLTAIVQREPISDYTVARNDTIASIAQQFDVTPESIIQLNRLGNPRVIHRGLVLKIPFEGRTAVAKPLAAPVLTEEVEVEAVTETVIAEPVVETAVVEPVVETAVEETTSEPTPEPVQVPNDGTQTYTVKGGDTLQNIANRYGVTIDALAHYNDLGNWRIIYPNQLLRIPPLDYLPPAPTELPPSASGYIWPIDSRRLAQGFYPGHDAIDILIATGSNVHAIANGTVQYAGWHNYGYGIMVQLVHDDGSRSLYAHNSELLVENGSYVSQGDVIALSGNTGRSTHPHIHLELIIGGQYVNPCDYLPGGC